VAGDDFSVKGKVVVNANTPDGTLLTAEAQALGFSDAITKVNADFDVRLVVTGGTLTGLNGPFKVGDSLAVLLHQPGLTIAKFPATFTITASATGTSDAARLATTTLRLNRRKPDPKPNRPALNDVCGARR
jgi:hypothetical protein